MTDGSKAAVWSAVWTPWGAAQAITGSATLNARFPGQWFQVEAGLHYNWHRHYDPTLGRYTQPDPLGFVDGPSVYAYAGSSPYRFVDRQGLDAGALSLPGGAAAAAACPQCAAAAIVGVGVGVAGYLIYQCIAGDDETTTDDPPPPDDDNDSECSRATKWQLGRARISNEHAFKSEYDAKPNSRFDICACKDGSIRIKRTNQCGKSGGPSIVTHATWK